MKKKDERRLVMFAKFQEFEKHIVNSTLLFAPQEPFDATQI